MQANNFLEFFPCNGIPVSETAMHIAIQAKGESFRNASNSFFDIQDKGFICTKFQSFTRFSSIFTCIFGTMIKNFQFDNNGSTASDQLHLVHSDMYCFPWTVLNNALL